MVEYQGEKFKAFLKSRSINTADAAGILNISRQAVYEYFKSANLQRETVNKILDAFKVSASDIWGDHLELTINASKNIEVIPRRLVDPEGLEATGDKFYELADGSLIMQVPIIPQKAYAGYLIGYADPEFYDDLSVIPLPVDKRHRGNYVGFEVEGRSMVCLESEELAERSIWPGRIAIGRELPKNKWQYKLHTHSYDTWIIVHKDDGILIKEISAHDLGTAEIVVHSLNPEYEDKKISLNDVVQIFSVVQIVNKKR